MKTAFCMLLLACVWVGNVCAQAPRTTNPKAAATPETLSFSEILAPDLTTLKPSEKLLRLNGQRVRIRGYMAEFETPTKGYFYLTPRRVHCDESGNGTGDLPVESIRVKAAKQPQREWPHIPAIIEVVGVIAIGPDATADEAGNYAAVRLLADEIFVLSPNHLQSKRRASTRSRNTHSSSSNRRPDQ